MITSHSPVVPADLSAWRQRKGISLSTIAATTRISLRYLEAIEAGRFHRLPGGAYTISYLRQYAQAIDYDAGDLVEYYRGVTMSEEASRAAPKPRETWVGRLWDHISLLRAMV
jgi:cytoskeletal protein RodZ